MFSNSTVPANEPDVIGRESYPILAETKVRSEDDSYVRGRIAYALGKIGFSGALDDVCVAWEDSEGEEVQGDLRRILYTFATIDPEKKNEPGKD